MAADGTRVDQVRDFRTLVASAAAFLFPVAFSPSVEASFWSPKMAVLDPWSVAARQRLTGQDATEPGP